jgi:hypothetical protein
VLRLTVARLHTAAAAGAMGFDRALFVGNLPAVEGFECVICHDVVADAVLCQQGHRRVRLALQALLC